MVVEAALFLELDKGRKRWAVALCGELVPAERKLLGVEVLVQMVERCLLLGSSFEILKFRNSK